MYKLKLPLAQIALAASAIVAGTPYAAQAQLPSNYGAYYTQNITRPGGLNSDTSNRYLYDKYFNNKATVSPYLNLARPGNASGANYQLYVRPELERREANDAASRAYIQQRKLEGRVGDTRLPGAGFVGGTINDARLKPMQKPTSTPSSYYNHWYGGWNK